MDESVTRKTKQHWEYIEKRGYNIDSGTPELLYKNGQDYLRWCDENPIYSTRTVTVGKDVGKKYEVEQPRPYTIKGLCMHCNVDEEYMADVRQCRDKTNMFYIVVTRLLYLIHTQNVEYATLDIFNSSLVAKLINIDKEVDPTSNQSVRVEIIPGLPILQESEDEVLKKLELENPDWIKANNKNS